MGNKRRRYLIDQRVQFGLVARMILQWACLLVAVVITLPLVRAILLGDVSTPLYERLRQAAVEAAVLLVVFLLLSPYLVYDSFKLTNRFVGPMYRLHQTFCALAAGERFQPIKFRSGDYWQEVAKDFNTMMAKLPTQNSPPNEASPDSDELSEELVATGTK